MAKNPEKRTFTKKHLAREQRERRQRRALIIAGAVVFAAVFGLLAFGVIEQAWIKPSQPVAAVGDEEITTREFQAEVKYQRRQLVQQYLNTYQNMQLFGTDQNAQAFFLQTLRQIEFQLDPVTMGQDVLNNMVENIIIRQEAEKRGITVTDKEVDTMLQEAFGYYPGGVAPTPTILPTTAPTSTLSATQLALIPPTPTASPTVEATAEFTSTVEATALAEATSVATEVSTGEAVPNQTNEASPPAEATPQPTPTPYTLEAYQQNYQDFVDTLKQEINFSEKQFRELFRSQVYRQKMLDEITGDIPRTQEQVWARHILVEDETTAEEVIQRLNAGESFVDLAAEYSIDDSNRDSGGDLGWFPVGRMDPTFETVAFNLSIGEISSPVETQFGWHIIQVLGHEERPLSSSEYEQAKQAAFDTWLTQQRQEYQVETFDVWQERVPIEPTIPPELQQL